MLEYFSKILCQPILLDRVLNQKKQMQLGGAAQNRKHFLDSHTAAPRSNPCFAEIFLLDNLSPYCLVSEQCCDQTYLELSNGFHKCSQRWRQKLSTTKKREHHNSKNPTYHFSDRCWFLDVETVTVFVLVFLSAKAAIAAAAAFN